MIEKINGGSCYFDIHVITKALQNNKCYIKIGLYFVNKTLCTLMVIKNENYM